MSIDNKLIFTPCGNQTTMVALDKNTGETIWKSEALSDKNAYSSPILVERGGKKIIVNISGNYLFGINSDDGKMLWKHKISQYSGADNGDINCNTPVYHDGCIFVTSGYDDTGLMFSLSEDGNAVSLKWKNSALDTHHGNVVLANGYIYGSNWINNGNGNWVCLDWNTGQTMYETKWKNKGSIIANDGLLYCYEEKSGNFGLVKADPKAFEVISSFKISNGKGPHWSHPVICDGRLYVRHDDFLMVYDLKNQ